MFAFRLISSRLWFKCSWEADIGSFWSCFILSLGKCRCVCKNLYRLSNICQKITINWIFTVCLLPITISKCFALVRATFILRSSLKNPILFSALTVEIIITSISCPWNASIVLTLYSIVKFTDFNYCLTSFCYSL